MSLTLKFWWEDESRNNKYILHSSNHDLWALIWWNDNSKNWIARDNTTYDIRNFLELKTAKKWIETGIGARLESQLQALNAIEE